MAKSPLDRVREICLALPQTTEKIAWGEPTFRVRDKMFVMFANNHHNDGIVGIWCAADDGAQDVLVRADPERFFVPPYMGPRGWIGVRLDDSAVDWGMVASIVEDAYRVIAPKGLAALLYTRPATRSPTSAVPMPILPAFSDLILPLSRALMIACSMRSAATVSPR
jgi:hypothetical protein